MSNKQTANASLQKLADSVQECKLYNVITPDMVHAIVDGEYGRDGEDHIMKEKLQSLPNVKKAIPEPYKRWNIYTSDKDATLQSLKSGGYDVTRYSLIKTD